MEMELGVMDSEDWMKMHVDIVWEGSFSSNLGYMVIQIPVVLYVELENFPWHSHSLALPQSMGIDR